MLKGLFSGLPITILLLVFAVSLPIQHVFAVEGSCSWHGGVNCSVGPDWDTSAICNDGWADSGERYFQQIECQKTPRCSQSQWVELSATDVMSTDRSRFSELINSINTLNIEYPMIEIKIQQSYIGRGATVSGIAPIISAEQRKNRNAVTTATYEAQLLDQKLRATQMEINKICIANGIEMQRRDEMEQQLRLQQAQTALQQAQSSQPKDIQNQSTQTTIRTDPYAQLTSDERCVKLNLGTFFNTDKQNCDTCPPGTTRVIGTNSCQKPVPVVKKTVNVQKQEAQVQATSSIKTGSTTAAISQAATSSKQVNSPPQKPATFIEKLISPFKGLWKRFFK